MLSVLVYLHLSTRASVVMLRHSFLSFSLWYRHVSASLRDLSPRLSPPSEGIGYNQATCSLSDRLSSSYLAPQRERVIEKSERCMVRARQYARIFYRVLLKHRLSSPPDDRRKRTLIW